MDMKNIFMGVPDVDEMIRLIHVYVCGVVRKHYLWSVRNYYVSFASSTNTYASHDSISKPGVVSVYISLTYSIASLSSPKYRFRPLRSSLWRLEQAVKLINFYSK